MNYFRQKQIGCDERREAFAGGFRLGEYESAEGGDRKVEILAGK